MIRNFEDLITHLRIFHKKIHKRLSHTLNKQLMGLLDQLQGFSYKFTAEVDTTNLQACLESVRKIKNFYPEKLRGPDLRAYLELGWEKKEVQILYGLSTNQLYDKIKAMNQRAKYAEKHSGAKGEAGLPELEIPQYLRDKDPSEYTDEDAFVIARLHLLRASAGGNVMASTNLVDRFQKFIQSDLKIKWEQVKILDNFFLSHFLPAVQKQLRINDPLPKIEAEVSSLVIGVTTGPMREAADRIKEFCQRGRIDAKSIFRDVLKEVSPEIRRVAERALEMTPGRLRIPETTVRQPELDSAIKKVKRRGKWVKSPNPEGAQAIFDKAMQKPAEPEGVMDLRPTPPEEEGKFQW